ncbi:SDR family oxidoreductase [Deinococcus frigens]|uniref:SDR family oxidoreductase n=1 Tax=Deinococcus frigens TaxID=249403 RepID=UPI00068CCBDE|nr:SDR family oxidoreductase [Deinococcus frigens]
MGVAIRCDHLNEAEVRALAERVRAEFGGLDCLVNDIWGGERFSEWGKKAWELDLSKVRAMLEAGLWSHVVTARHLLPLLR